MSETTYLAQRLPARCVQPGVHWVGRGYWPIIAVRPYRSDVRIDYRIKDGSILTAVEHRDSIVNVFAAEAR